MVETKNGMEPLPGFPSLRQFETQRNAELEHKYPGLRDIFDHFLQAQVPSYIFDIAIKNRKEFPIDAAIVLPNVNTGFLDVISTAITSTNRDRNSTQHGELVAIEKALTRSGTKHLPEGAILLSMVEPCGMCAGALHHAGGKDVIFGASQRDMDSVEVSIDDVQKPFRSEPEGYSVEEYLRARSPESVVVGGYRKSDVLEFVGNGTRPKTAATEN